MRARRRLHSRGNSKASVADRCRQSQRHLAARRMVGQRRFLRPVNRKRAGSNRVKYRRGPRVRSKVVLSPRAKWVNRKRADLNRVKCRRAVRVRLRVVLHLRAERAKRGSQLSRRSKAARLLGKLAQVSLNMARRKKAKKHHQRQRPNERDNSKFTTAPEKLSGADLCTSTICREPDWLSTIRFYNSSAI